MQLRIQDLPKLALFGKKNSLLNIYFDKREENEDVESEIVFVGD